MPMYPSMGVPQPYYGGMPFQQQPWQQPQPQQQAPDPNQIEGVRWVSSQAEVDGTSLPFGKKALFMSSAPDSNDFWIKEVAPNGVPTTRHFRYEEVVPPNPDNFITRDEFDQRIAEAMMRWEEQRNAQPDIPAAATQAPAAQLDAAGPSLPFVPGQPPAGQGAVLPNGSAAGMDPAAAQYVS